MIRLVVAMVTLALAASAPAWAQERRLKHELRQEQKLAEKPEIDATDLVPDLDVEEAPEAGENDPDTAREVFTTDDLEELDAAEAELRGDTGEASDESAEEGESSEEAESSEEEVELIEARAIPPDAGRPEPSGIPGAPTFQEQLGTLIVDLQLDRASGRQYARAPERGKESLIQDVTLAIGEQLRTNECWAEEDSVIAGRRVTIAIALRYDVDGRFVEEPRLVSPPEAPADDPSVRRFIDRAFSALRACNANGIKLPAKYYEDPIWVYLILQSRPE
jgi:hypothetical protein